MRLSHQEATMEKLVVILLCLPLFFFCYGQTSDQTIQPHAHGEDVVDAVMNKIRSKCILIDDKFMMRRIAAVVDFGQNSLPNTGGIWKVSGSILTSAKTNCQNRWRRVCNEILQEYSFDINRATMTEMEVPLYSALVMHVYISGFGTLPASKSDQADFWIKYVRPKGNKKSFIAKSSIKASCSATEMELVFAIDASGSVKKHNFEKTLSFLQSVVMGLQIAPDMTRVAVIRYSTSAQLAFNLDTFNSQSDIINSISNITYTGGGTSTYRAIDLARTEIFKNARENVPKVFVLITDGRSSSRTRTVSAADRLKGEATTIFTVGIGRVNDAEMLAVASSPDCVHYFSLKSYNEIDAIIHEIQRESCEAPVSMDFTGATRNETVIENNQIPPGNGTGIKHIDIQPGNHSQDQNTTDIKVDVNCGIVTIYASQDFNKPNAAIYTYKAIATDGNPGWIRSPATQKLYLSFFSQSLFDLVTSNCTNAHYNISFNPEDTGVTVICRENGKERQCTSEDIKLSFVHLCGDDNVPNPCTKANILKNKMRFKHPKSLTKYIQCKLSGQMEIVNCPTGKQYDESQRVCDPQIMGLPKKPVLYTGANPCTRQAIMNGQRYFANPSDKSTFIQCDEWGTAFLVNCTKNRIWSQLILTCVLGSSGVSPNVNPCIPSNTSSYYENPASRKSFIKCDVSGNAQVVPCQIGTVWSQANLTCVQDSISVGSTTTETKACTNGEFLPDPTDPNKYRVCGWKGALTVMSCPKGLVWQQSAKVCNWPSGSSGI